MKEQTDEMQGTTNRVIMDWRASPRGSDLKPAILIKESKGGKPVRVSRGVDARYLLPVDDKEFLLRDEFGANVAAAETRWIEPAWRMLLSGKGLLALLWELFPGHPNLLPAFREPGRTGGKEIAKPLWGREGANVTAPGLTTDGPYGAEGFVHQAWAELPCTDGRYAVIGSWLIEGVPRGIGIREDSTPITRDTSRFVPHFFDPRPDGETA